MQRHRLLSAFLVGVAASLLLPSVVEIASAAAVTAETASTAAPLGVYLTNGVGDSMQPTMGPGDRALCLEQIEPETGDVVTVDGAATGSSHNVRHRVVAMNGSHVVTKGDGNDYRDDPVPRSAVRCTTIWAEGAGWNP